MLREWFRGGRLGERSVFLGLGPWDLWFGIAVHARPALYVNILPGAQALEPEFDHWFDMMIGRFRLTLIWLGLRPGRWPS